MKIVVDTDYGYGCKGCPFHKRNSISGGRYCSLTGHPTDVDEIRAMIRGATLIDCPREIAISMNEMYDLINVGNV